MHHVSLIHPAPRRPDFFPLNRLHAFKKGQFCPEMQTNKLIKYTRNTVHSVKLLLGMVCLLVCKSKAILCFAVVIIWPQKHYKLLLVLLTDSKIPYKGPQEAILFRNTA